MLSLELPDDPYTDRLVLIEPEIVLRDSPRTRECYFFFEVFSRDLLDREDDLAEDLVLVLRIGRDRELGVRYFLSHVLQEETHHVDRCIL